MKVAIISDRRRRPDFPMCLVLDVCLYRRADIIESLRVLIRKQSDIIQFMDNEDTCLYTSLRHEAVLTCDLVCGEDFATKDVADSRSQDSLTSVRFATQH